MKLFSEINFLIFVFSLTIWAFKTDAEISETRQMILDAAKSLNSLKSSPELEFFFFTLESGGTTSNIQQLNLSGRAPNQLNGAVPGINQDPNQQNLNRDIALRISVTTRKTTKKPLTSLGTTKSSTTSKPCRLEMISSGDIIRKGECIISEHKCFKLSLENNGDLVLYRTRDSKVIWEKKSPSSGTVAAGISKNGAFYLETSGNDVFLSRELNFRPVNLKVRDNGKVEVTSAGDVWFKGPQAIDLRHDEIHWSSNTTSDC